MLPCFAYLGEVKVGKFAYQIELDFTNEQLYILFGRREYTIEALGFGAGILGISMPR